MRMSIIAFAIGVWFLQQQAALPGWFALGALAAVSLGLTFIAWRMRGRWRRGSSIIAAAIAGFAWAAAMGEIRLADSLPVENEGRDIHLTGVIASLPQVYDNGVRFDFAVEQAEAAVPAKISLAWPRGWRAEQAEQDDKGPAPQAVHAGERWQLTVRLKRPHGNFNPHSFDYEAWLFEQGVRATGYVRNDDGNRRLDAFVPQAGYAVERLRELVRERFLRALPERDYAGVLVALVVGDQRAIDNGLWQLFARTGISHLMSISGLHITMVAALGAWCASALWRRKPALMLRLPAQKVAAAAGWATAFAYCLLAGFGVPAQRTLYMLTVVALALWLGRAAAGSRVLTLALLLVLLLDPWAVLSAGFWLSFGAVAVLFYVGAGRLASPHWLAGWGRTQWAVTLAQIPALLAIFQQFSLVSPLANAVAIPAVSFVITPLALLAAVLPFDAPMLLAHQLLSWLMAFIEWLAALPLAVWQQHAPPDWAVGLAALGCAWMLLPRGFPSRGVGALLLLPLVFIAPPRPAEGELRLTVLDVGHGLAVHAQTASHDLMYDTGPRFSTDANSGNRILLPYLRAVGVRKLDGLVLSHEDDDHAGGALSLIDGLPVTWTTSSVPEGHPFRAASGYRPCAAGQNWALDGVRFEMLHPAAADDAAVNYAERVQPREQPSPLASFPDLPPANRGKEALPSPPLQGEGSGVGMGSGRGAGGRPITRKSNNMSCVLKITSAHGSALLTGDIEIPSERTLLKSQGEQLRADVLVAPHHGSRSSSSAEFLTAVSPRTAIFSIGYRNRFHHPNEAVWRRYEESGAQLLRTDRDGAVTLDLAVPPRQTFERTARRRYWQSVLTND